MYPPYILTEVLRTIADDFFTGDAQRESLRAALAELAMPVHVIWGSVVRIIPAAHAEGLPEAVTVNVLEGYDHVVQFEAATEGQRAARALSRSSARFRRRTHAPCDRRAATVRRSVVYTSPEPAISCRRRGELLGSK